MTRTEELVERLDRIWSDPRGVYGGLSTIDHKTIGTRYLVTAMAFLIIGGIEALVIRLQLAGRAAVCSPRKRTTSS